MRAFFNLTPRSRSTAMNALGNLRTQIQTFFKLIDKKWVQRTRVLSTEKIVFLSHQKAIQDKGLQHVISINRVDVSAAAVCKARQKMPVGEFRKALHMFSSTTRRILAIDGSKVHIAPSFASSGFKTRTNDKPVPRPAKRIMCMLSSLVDTSTRCCLDFQVTKHFNERKAATELLRSVRKSDTILFDRGYYSRDLVQSMLSRNIDFVMRLKIDAFRSVRPFMNSRLTKASVPFGDKDKVYLNKYTLDGKKYVCLTSTDLSSREVRDLYKKRWRVEEHFKRLKSHLHMDRSKSLTPKTLFLDFEITIFLDALSITIGDREGGKRKRRSQVLVLASMFVLAPEHSTRSTFFFYHIPLETFKTTRGQGDSLSCCFHADG